MPTAIYAAGEPEHRAVGCDFGLVYDPNTQVWAGNTINYFSASLPDRRVPERHSPDGAEPI